MPKRYIHANLVSIRPLAHEISSTQCRWDPHKKNVPIPFVKKGEGVGTYLEKSKGAKIRNQFNQVPHLTQDTNGKVTKSQLYTTNESQKVSPFPAGDHKSILQLNLV